MPFNIPRARLLKGSATIDFGSILAGVTSRRRQVTPPLLRAAAAHTTIFNLTL